MLDYDYKDLDELYAGLGMEDEVPGNLVGRANSYKFIGYRQVNFLRFEESSLGPQATALSHSVNALILRSR